VEETIGLSDKYIMTFRGPIAREVLADIVLGVCNYGSTMDHDDPAQVARYNVAVHILGMCNIFPQAMLNNKLNAEPEVNKKVASNKLSWKGNLIQALHRQYRKFRT
jgi:hypothetical protein